MISLQKAFVAVQDVAELPCVEYHLDLLKGSREKNLAYARHVHTHIHLYGLGPYPSLANHLVLLFVRFESLQNALQVFLGLPHRDVCTWNCLIEGYVEYGDFQHALKLYQHMQNDHVQSNRYTLQVLLKACGGLKCVEHGQAIHNEIAREGFESHPFIGSTLVDMYVKCGLLAEALEVFQTFTSRDVVAWTALMSGYADHGLGVEVLSCLEQMQQDGISPNAATLVCCLKGCGSIEYVEKGHELFAYILKLGLESNTIVANALLDMYTKCGALKEAKVVFDALPNPCVIAWTSLISGHAEDSSSEDVFELFERMKSSGVPPNEVTAVCCLKGCSSKGTLVVGQKIHIDVVKYGFEGDTFVGTALIDFYVRCGCLMSALLVFDRLPMRNVVCWNALLAGYAEEGLASEVWNCMEEMMSEGVSMDVTTYVSIIKACNMGGSLEVGLSIHAEVVKAGLERHLIVGSALVDMYASCGFSGEAREVLDELPFCGVVAWTALMAGHVEQERGEDVLACYDQMAADGILPNSFTYICVLKACGYEAAVNRGRGSHAEIVKKGIEQSSFIGSALLDMYTRCSMLEEAHVVFDRLPVRDVVLWSAWIAGCARGGGGMLAIESFEQMRQEGIPPEDITFSSILAVCSHEGLVDMGLSYFESMITEYNISPTIEHSNCLVDLLGRAGQLSVAVVLLESIPGAPTPITWNILLGACKKWGSLHFGRQAFDYALRLNIIETASYYLMSGIYADGGMWVESK